MSGTSDSVDPWSQIFLKQINDPEFVDPVDFEKFGQFLKELFSAFEGTLPKENDRIVTILTGLKKGALSESGDDDRKNFLDEHFCREFLRDAPQMVERTLKLAILVPKLKPSGRVDNYLREAARCYIYGFWTASIALSRSVLEHSLRDRLSSIQAPSPPSLKDLISTAIEKGVLDGYHSDLAVEIQKKGNIQLHKRPASSSEAYDVLVAARSVVAFLFQAETVD